MISLSATRAFKAYHFEVPHNLSKNEILFFTLKNFPTINENYLYLTIILRSQKTNIVMKVKNSSIISLLPLDKSLPFLSSHFFPACSPSSSGSLSSPN